MPYNNVISRSDVEALIPEDYTRQIIDGAVEQSVALTRFRNVPVSRKVLRMPVLSALPVAYFVNGDTGLKQTTELNWGNKFLEIEEIACIVPIADAVLDDADYDIWGESMPRLQEAVGRTLDAAVFFGANKPTSWPASIVAAATAAGNSVTRGTNNAASGGIAGDVSDTMAKVETDGFDVNTILTSRSYKGRFRNTRDTQGQPLVNMQGEIYDTPISYAVNGLWPTGAGAAELIAMDGNEFVVGVRQDFTFKIFREGVITDNSGAIIYNLMQQDMSAMRIVFRVGWQVSNNITTSQVVEANRYPAGVLAAP